MTGLDDARSDTGRPKRGGPLSFVRRNLFWCIVASLLAVMVGGLAYLRTWPPMAIVQSGSMVPTIQIGDVVVLRHLDGPPKVGQIILVHVPDSARQRFGYPPVITHRVYAIHDGEITTKGDALKTVDPFLTPENTVTEHVVAIIPDAGRIYGFFTSTWGMMWLLAGVVLLVGLPLMERYREREERERVAFEALQEKLAMLAGGAPVAGGLPPSASLEREVRALAEEVASTRQTLVAVASVIGGPQPGIDPERAIARRQIEITPPKPTRSAAQPTRSAAQLPPSASSSPAAPVAAADAPPPSRPGRRRLRGKRFAGARLLRAHPMIVSAGAAFAITAGVLAQSGSPAPLTAHGRTGAVRAPAPPVLDAPGLVTLSPAARSGAGSPASAPASSGFVRLVPTWTPSEPAPASASTLVTSWPAPQPASDAGSYAALVPRWPA